jgi:hypothetical protein
MKRLAALGLAICLFLPLDGHGYTLKQRGLIGWSIKYLAVNVNYTSCPIGRQALEDLVDQAFDIWNAVATANVQLIRGSNSASTPAQAFGFTAPDVPVIVCDPNLSTTISTSADRVPVYSDIQQNSGAIVSGFILLNTESGMTYNIQNLSTTQLSIALAHEVGHLLGLGHSNDETSLMHYNYMAKTHLLLSQDDIDGITYLYTRVEPEEDKVFGCATIAGPSAPTGTFMALITLPIALLALMRRRQRPVSA